MVSFSVVVNRSFTVSHPFNATNLNLICTNIDDSLFRISSLNSSYMLTIDALMSNYRIMLSKTSFLCHKLHHLLEKKLVSKFFLNNTIHISTDKKIRTVLKSACFTYYAYLGLKKLRVILT